MFDENVLTNKTQIVLLNSFRIKKDFDLQIKNRFSGDHKRAPHFFISKEGEVINFLNSDSKSEFFNFNYSAITVCLENLGWLEKVPTKDYYSNFLGYTKKSDIYEKKRRDYFYWDTYSDNQIIECAKLCKGLLKKYKMKN